MLPTLIVLVNLGRPLFTTVGMKMCNILDNILMEIQRGFLWSTKSVKDMFGEIMQVIE